MQNAQYIIHAALSFFAVYLAAKISAAAQLRDRAIDVYLTARLSSYREFEESIRLWTLEKSAQNAASVFRFANEARLVSSESTGLAIAEVAEMIESYMSKREFDVKAFRNCRLDCFRRLQQDLSTYPVPDPAEFWFTRLFRRIRLLLRSCRRRS